MFEMSKFTRDDYDLYLDLVYNKKVMEMNYGRTFSEQEAECLFNAIIGINRQYNSSILGYYKVFLPQKAAHIGLWGITQSNDRCLEIEYMLLPQYWGKGYATKMVAQGIAAITQALPNRLIHAITDTANLASRKVLEKNGFRFVKDFINDEGETVSLFER